MNKPQSAMIAAAIALMAAYCAAAPCLRAADPGELFPDVAAYDDKVAAPVSRPEGDIKRTHTPSAENPTTPLDPPTSTAPANPADAPTPSAPATAPAQPQKPRWYFQPYAQGLLSPLLDPADQAAFDQKYADKISKALAGKLDDRRKVSAELAADAVKEKNAKLKRYLLLHSLGLAIRGAAPVSERAARANTVLPMLTEETLAASQARADCLNDLLLSSVSPAESLLDANADAYTTLAILQVQGGFPREAVEALKKAREYAGRCKEKSPDRAAELAEAGAWVDRSSTASGMWPRWQQLLKTKPEDPFANTQCAILHLALYGHLANAQPFAARSDKPELRALAQAIHALLASEETQVDPARAFAVCLALAEVAKKVPVHPFDKFSIAMLAGEHTSAMLSEKALTPAQQEEAKALLLAMKDVIDKGSVKPGFPPQWLGGFREQSTTKLVLEEETPPEEKIPQKVQEQQPENKTPTTRERRRRGFSRWLR